jgi:hypothetical protein
MKQVLKTIHFEMFRNGEREALFMRTHHDDQNEKIRNDERISQCRHFDKVLRKLEDVVISKL